MLLIVVVIVAVMLVVGIGVFELVGTLVERKTRERFKKARLVGLSFSRPVRG